MDDNAMPADATAARPAPVPTPPKTSRRPSARNLRWIVGVLLIAGVAVVLWLATPPPPPPVEGEVSGDRVDISPGVAGRVVKLKADVGDTVERGVVIAELESPQLGAALVAARAALGVAKADLDRVNSTRPETIEARRADVA